MFCCNHVPAYFMLTTCNIILAFNHGIMAISHPTYLNHEEYVVSTCNPGSLILIDSVCVINKVHNAIVEDSYFNKDTCMYTENSKMI